MCFFMWKINGCMFTWFGSQILIRAPLFVPSNYAVSTNNTSDIVVTVPFAPKAYNTMRRELMSPHTHTHTHRFFHKFFLKHMRNSGWRIRPDFVSWSTKYVGSIDVLGATTMEMQSSPSSMNHVSKIYAATSTGLPNPSNYNVNKDDARAFHYMLV